MILTELLEEFVSVGVWVFSEFGSCGRTGGLQLGVSSGSFLDVLEEFACLLRREFLSRAITLSSVMYTSAMTMLTATGAPSGGALGGS